MVTISVILAACTTAPRLAAPENDQADTPDQELNQKIQVSGAEVESDGGTTGDFVSNQAGTQGDTQVFPDDDQTAPATTPVPPTDTSKTEVTQSTTTTTTTDVAASTEDITDLLDDLDSMLSLLGDQLDGLDDDLADVETSLNADEGDIEE